MRIVVDPSGSYGSLSIDGNGQWTFTLNDSSNSVNQLDEGDTATDTFTVRATDSFGQQSESQVEITITGTNDAPTLSGSQLSKTITEDGATVVSGQLQSGIQIKMMVQSLVYQVPQRWRRNIRRSCCKSDNRTVELYPKRCKFNRHSTAFTDDKFDGDVYGLCRR